MIVDATQVALVVSEGIWLRRLDEDCVCFEALNVILLGKNVAIIVV